MEATRASSVTSVVSAMRQPKKWRPSPYAIAELVLGRELPEGDEEAMLRKALLLTGPLDAPYPDSPTIIDFFDDVQLSRNLFDSVGDALRAVESLWPRRTHERLHMLVADLQRRNALETVVGVLANVNGLTFSTSMRGGQALQVGSYQDANGSMVVEGAEFHDPVQGPWNSCWLIASFSAVAWSVQDWSDRLKATGFTNNRPWHAWAFFDSPAAFEIEQDLPFDNNGQALFTRSRSAGELWPSMMEKAWVMRAAGLSTDVGSTTVPDIADYRSLDNDTSNIDDVLVALAGGVGTKRFRPEGLLPGQTLFSVLDGVRAPWKQFGPSRTAMFKRPVVAWTGSDASASAENVLATLTSNNIARQHAFAVLGLLEVNQVSYIVLRDPRGKPCGLKPLPVSNWLTEEVIRGGQRSVRLGKSGVGAITVQDFEKSFLAVAWLT